MFRLAWKGIGLSLVIRITIPINPCAKDNLMFSSTYSKHNIKNQIILSRLSFLLNGKMMVVLVTHAYSALPPPPQVLCQHSV